MIDRIGFGSTIVRRWWGSFGSDAGREGAIQGVLLANLVTATFSPASSGPEATVLLLWGGAGWHGLSLIHI